MEDVSGVAYVVSNSMSIHVWLSLRIHPELLHCICVRQLLTGHNVKNKSCLYNALNIVHLIKRRSPNIVSSLPPLLL